jgi:plasmid stabilization system protein ParE
MESIHEFVAAESSNPAAAWFIELVKAVQSLERYPERGAIAPENRNLRQLVFGKKPSIYRIIYAVNKRDSTVNVVHIRHGARGNLLSAFDDV